MSLLANLVFTPIDQAKYSSGTGSDKENKKVSLFGKAPPPKEPTTVWLDSENHDCYKAFLYLFLCHPHITVIAVAGGAHEVNHHIDLKARSNFHYYKVLNSV